MHYSSTREKTVQLTASQAIKQGLAADGGLFVPESIPKITADEIQMLSGVSYSQKAAFILAKFMTDYTAAEIEEIVSVYNKNKFETDNVAPVYKLNSRTYILELWHGPTCAFKDMALQVLPKLLTKAVAKSGDDKRVMILTATSGDTGKAALEGFKDVDGTRITVFYPENGVSKMQKLQMTTQEGENVAVCAVKGNFDDAQTAVKQVFTDDGYRQELFEKGYVFSSANSINWGRLAPQIVYYFSAYCDMLANEELKNGESINVVVPTGNFGNILAAYYAKQMGLPIAKLICASNKNNILTDFIAQGVYDKNREFHTTASPSMDILISSNLERLIYDLSGCDTARTKQWMNQLIETGTYQIPEIMQKKLTEMFWGGYCDDEDTSLTIKDTFEAYGYLVDPHTAVGKNVYDQYLIKHDDQTKTIIASTASPFKFADFTANALGIDITDMDEFGVLNAVAQRSDMKIPNELNSLRTKSQRFTRVSEKDRIKDYISSSIN